MMHLGFLTISPAYAVSGLLVGLLVGLTGVGGGSLMTPLLVMMFGFHPSTAVGTDLLFAAVTKTVGTTIHSAGKTVDWRIVGRLAMGSAPATILTLLVVAHFGVNSKGVTNAISSRWASSWSSARSRLLFKDWLIAQASKRNPDLALAPAPWKTILVGLVLGVLVSLTSVGAGALGTIALLVLYPKLPVVRIVGSDIAHAVPLTLLAGHRPLVSRHDQFPAAGLAAGGLHPRHHRRQLRRPALRPDTVLKSMLGIILAIVGIKLLSSS